jgi:hypothetical protein
MTAGTAAADTARVATGGIGALRLARLWIRFRLRSLWNGMRARGRGRFPLLLVLVGLMLSLSYVGLFWQSFGVLCAHTGVDGQITALALVTLTIAVGNLTAKAASSEAVLAGSSENEFLLSRPVALPTLVVARCLAEAATDPLGALFLLPVMLAAAKVWDLPRGALLIAALASMLVQLGISALAQATQISLVRFVPRARRRTAWMGLRLVALVSLAAVWMIGVRVMRAPESLAALLPTLAPYVGRSPGALIVGPFAGLLRHSASDAALALGALAAATASAVGVAALVARVAGMRGWEEAGASWADAMARPSARRGRLLTAATKDLVLVSRDRGQLVALIAMPIIIVGVQLFGALGWRWSTADLVRVSHVAFSLCLYMATLGPLTHMQAERRAFWILRAVPVPIGQLLAAKARAWSVIMGTLSLCAYSIMSLGAPPAGVLSWVDGALVVVGGSVAMTWLAVALAASAADLSDDARPAFGPATIYAYIFVGFLYNALIGADPATRARGYVLYAFAIAAYWLEGVERANVCLDAELVRERRLTLRDGATLLIVFTVGQIGAARAAPFLGPLGFVGQVVASLAVPVGVGLAAALYLARRPSATGPRTTWARAIVVALGLGGAAAAGIWAMGRANPAFAGAKSLLVGAALAIPLVVAQELLLRGLIQRGLEELSLRRGGHSATRGRALAAFVSVLFGVVAVGPTGAAAAGILLASHGASAVTRAITGRNSASILTRVVALAAALAWGPIGP